MRENIFRALSVVILILVVDANKEQKNDSNDGKPFSSFGHRRGKQIMIVMGALKPEYAN